MSRFPRLLLLSAAVTFITTASAFPAFRLTPEQPIADPAVAAAEGNRYASALASDGSAFMAFWTGSGSIGLYATRVTADGVVVGPPHMTISVASTIRTLAACWSGTSYVVAWQQDENNAIYAAAIAPDGSIRTAPQLVVQNGRMSAHGLASNGARVFMTYAQLANGNSLGVRAALLDTNGVVVATNLSLPVTASAIEEIPAVASDGKDFAIVWRTGVQIVLAASPVPPPAQYFNDFHFLRLTGRAESMGTQIDLGRTDPTQDFGVAYGGGVYAVVALQGYGTIPGAKVVRFAADDASGTATRLPDIENTAGFRADVAWNGSRFVAYWMNYDFNYYKLLAVTFSGTAEATAPQPVIAVSGSHLGHEPLIAFNGRGAFATWIEDTYDTHGAASNIVGARFDRDVTLTEGKPVLVSIGWSRQYQPVIATSGSDSLVVWMDEHGTNNGGDILAARIAPSGAIIDRTPITIASGTGGGPLVVFNGTSYLVVWTDTSSQKVVARTVGRDGALGPTVSFGPGWGVSIAANATTTLLAMTQTTAVVAIRLDRNAQPIDTTPIVIGSGGYMPRVATNGTDFLVAWNVGSDYWQFPTPNAIDVLAARVSANGTVLDAAPIEIATGGADQILQAIGSDGRDYLVVYTYRSTENALAAKRVLREGQLDGTTASDIGTVVTRDTPDYFAVAIAPNDTGFWIAWANPYATPPFAKLAQADRNGAPSDVVPMPGVSLISLADAPGQMLEIVYARRVTDGAYAGTSRVFLRFAGDLRGRSHAVRR